MSTAMSRGLCAPGASAAIVDEDVGAEQKEQQHALKDLRDRRGKAQVLLRLFAAEIEQGHQQAREKDADRIEAADEGDDDRREPVVARYMLGDLPHGPSHLTHSGNPCRRASGQETHPYGAIRRKPRVARSRLRLSGDLHLKTEKAALHEDVPGQQGAERQQECRIQPRAFDEDRQNRRVLEHLRLREVEAFRVSPRPVDEPTRRRVARCTPASARPGSRWR
jgi:hypothetical protein